MGADDLLLLFAAEPCSLLLLLADKAVTHLAQALDQRVGALAHPGGVAQHLRGVLGQFLGGILQFHFRHSTLAPPHLFADFIG